MTMKNVELFVTSKSATDFSDLCADVGMCMRCRATVDRGKSWSSLAQISPRGKSSSPLLAGGVLCNKCVESFLRWMYRPRK